MSSSRCWPQVIQDMPWLAPLLQSWRDYYIELALAPASQLSYSSAFQAYQVFCMLHGHPLDPTPDTLSLFITFKSLAI